MCLRVMHLLALVANSHLLMNLSGVDIMYQLGKKSIAFVSILQNSYRRWNPPKQPRSTVCWYKIELHLECLNRRFKFKIVSSTLLLTNFKSKFYSFISRKNWKYRNDRIRYWSVCSYHWALECNGKSHTGSAICITENYHKESCNLLKKGSKFSRRT